MSINGLYMLNYQQITTLPKLYVKQKVLEFMSEDIPDEDYTSLGTIPPDTHATAYIEAQEDLIFAGLDIIFAFFDENFKVEIFFKDGDKVLDGEKIAQFTGNLREILKIERSLLNILQRLCGIATITNRYVYAAQGKIKILDTRKTIPGLRLFDKFAVVAGGGVNHRLNLSSGILIKDNHIAGAGGIKPALIRIQSMGKHLPIELEVDNFEQIEEALQIGVDGFLLDNMLPETVKKAVELIRSHKNGKTCFIECSGGITLKNIPEYAETGIDAVSVGALTHSVIAANMHLEIMD
jgi:nicotinate-nucleotide pyrophosphorylase (carboxylating)